MVTVGVLSIAVSAFQAGQQIERIVEVEKVKDNLFVLKGGGGNTGVFVATNGVVVIDTKNQGWGQPVIDAIGTFTDEPVMTIINTHTHGDHTSGNVEFPATVEIVAQANTKTNMTKETGPRDERNDIFKGDNARFLPKRTFTDRMSLGEGADRIDLYYFGRGHTDGDAWIVFPALRVMQAGDSFSGKNPPYLDARNGASSLDYPETLARAVKTIGDVDLVISGHAGVMTWEDLRAYADFNRELLGAVTASLKSGQSVEEVANAYSIPAKYKDYDFRYPFKDYVQVVSAQMPD
jgi:glyoxylase-like metal-dependent hydrolase (beta-lactamase superfamily II)